MGDVLSGWVGDVLSGWVGDVYTSFEKRRVLFIYLMVDKMIFLFSLEVMDGCPYKYNFDWFPK